MNTDTITYMRFKYNGDQLESIVADSSKELSTRTTFYGAGTSTVTDSTFLTPIDGARALRGVRTINYDSEGNPVSVAYAQWYLGGSNNELAELTWENGNVVKLVTYDIATGEKVLLRDLTISHDDQNCLYMKNNGYLFTFQLKDLFWLSKNNPVVFTDAAGERKYTYWYNKLGYPSNFKTDTGVLYGTSYIQLR
jgi:hypothetical protein